MWKIRKLRKKIRKCEKKLKKKKKTTKFAKIAKNLKNLAKLQKLSNAKMRIKIEKREKHIKRGNSLKCRKIVNTKKEYFGSVCKWYVILYSILCRIYFVDFCARVPSLYSVQSERLAMHLGLSASCPRHLTDLVRDLLLLPRF